VGRGWGGLGWVAAGRGLFHGGVHACVRTLPGRPSTCPTKTPRARLKRPPPPRPRLPAPDRAAPKVTLPDDRVVIVSGFLDDPGRPTGKPAPSIDVFDYKSRGWGVGVGGGSLGGWLWGGARVRAGVCLKGCPKGLGAQLAGLGASSRVCRGGSSNTRKQPAHSPALTRSLPRSRPTASRCARAAMTWARVSSQTSLRATSSTPPSTSCPGPTPTRPVSRGGRPRAPKPAGPAARAVPEEPRERANPFQ
jgi:hypothetical protein